MTSDPGEITALIQEWQTGNRMASDKLMEIVYPELRRIAGAYLNRERPGHTLEPTALVNELYVKLIASCPITLRNRTHFFALAAQCLRHILVDYARLHRAKKRGRNGLKVTVSAAELGFATSTEDLLSVHEALTQFQQLDPRAAKVVELRFFGGLDEEQVAEVLEVSKNTVQRDWKTARAWLASRLQTKRNPGQKHPHD
jgi:RNA polymerase sigma-70 factor, ECF subfamily